jgi:methionyl-tRNA synthetase
MPDDPMALWMNLGTRTNEMLVASAQVIGHRTARMAQASPIPSEPDQREFALMGQEKIEAATAAAQAMAAHMMASNPEFGIQAFSQMMTGMSDWMSLGASRTPHELIERQAKLMRTLTDAVLSTSQLAVPAARIAEAGLSPIHAKATANARRLSRHK